MMVEIRKPIPVGEAVERVLAHAAPTGAETVPLEESPGRILAEPVAASHPVPPFNRSPYDGFALRAEDTAGASGSSRIQFTVIDEIPAGSVSGKKLGEKQAARIMTGAPLPDGADAVVMFEQTVEDGETFTIRKPFEPLENVSLKGEDLAEGEEVVPAGSFIHAGTVAVLATFGYAHVKVARRPVVGILATGTELVGVGEPLAPGKIRNSNGPMIAAQLRRMGIECRTYGAEADDLYAVVATVERALSETDALITTGGVSVGDFDYLPAVYKKIGAEVLFNKVAMRPGSVTTIAAGGGKLLFGLSGNPSSCFTGFELFTRPALLKMMGADKLFLPHTKAVLGEDFTKPNPFTRFVRAVYDGHTASPAGFNKSNAVSSIARGNAMIVLPGGTRGFRKGDEVDVLLLGVEEGSAQWKL